MAVPTTCRIYGCAKLHVEYMDGHVQATQDIGGLHKYPYVFSFPFLLSMQSCFTAKLRYM